MHGVKALAGHEEEVVAAYVAGASLDQLSERHGCSVKALRRFLLDQGVRLRPSGAPWPYDPETEALIAEEYEAGFTPKKLAYRYGGDERTVRKAVRKQGGTIRPERATPVDEAQEEGGPGAALRILVGASVIFTVLLVGAYLLSYWNADRPALASTRQAAASTASTSVSSTTTPVEPASAPAPMPTTSTSTPTTSTTSTSTTSTSTTTPAPPYEVALRTCQQVGDDLTMTGTLVNHTGTSQSFRVQVLVVDADGETLDESFVTSPTLDDGEDTAWSVRGTSSVDLRDGGSCQLGLVEPVER